MSTARVTFPLPFLAIPQATPGSFEGISQDIAQNHQGKEGKNQGQGYAGMFPQPAVQGAFPFSQLFHALPLQPRSMTLAKICRPLTTSDGSGSPSGWVA